MQLLDLSRVERSYYEFDRFYLSIITKRIHNIILDIFDKIKIRLKEQPQNKTKERIYIKGNNLLQLNHSTTEKGGLVVLARMQECSVA